MSNLVSRDKSESLVLVNDLWPRSSLLCACWGKCGSLLSVFVLQHRPTTGSSEGLAVNTEGTWGVGLSEQLPLIDWPHRYRSSRHYSWHFAAIPATKQTFCNLKSLSSSSLSSFLFHFLTSSTILTDSTASDLINFYNDTLSSCRNQLAPLKTVTMSSTRPHHTTQIFTYLKSIADSSNNSKVKHKAQFTSKPTKTH